MRKLLLMIAATLLLVASCVNPKEAGLRFEKYQIQDLEATPDFWKVTPSQIVDVCKNVTRGHSEVIATTPAGLPVYAYFHGDFSEAAPQTNWSAGNSSSAISAYLGDQSHPQTVMLLAGVHGAEPEATAAAVNMIQMLETGKDFRGVTDTTFLDLASRYRLIIIPCANMDGRAICPDHLRGQPYEVFRAVCQGTWADGSLVGWRESKRYFPLPIDKVSFPGGYPNSEGYNIQHDLSPGDMRTEEAKAICRLMSRWRVDAMLNAHSCEHAPHMVLPSMVDTKRHVERGCEIADTVNARLLASGLRLRPHKAECKETLNLSSIVNWCSGGFGITLECSSSYDNIHNPKICYTFEQMMEPVFMAMNAIMESGLSRPLADRVQESVSSDVDMKKARETFLRLTEMNYAPDEEVAKTMMRLSDGGRANDVMLLQLYMAVHLPDEEVERLLGMFDWERGAWTDIDYESKRRARWHPSLHVTRMYALAKLYKAGSERWKGSKELQKLLHSGIRLWYDMMPVCPNWWHNEIGVPKKYAAVLLMLRDELTAEELEGGLKVLAKAKFGRTGQNKMWLAGNNLMRGLLIDDEAVVERACREIQETIFVTEGEGIQPDWSFHQHGPQIQFGNYGLAFVDGVSFWMAVLNGTKYDFSDSHKEIICNLIKEGTSWCVYQGCLDLNFCGRQNFINAGRGKATAFAIAAMYMAMSSDDERDFYTRIADANLVPSKYPNSLVGERYFWRSDCGIYRRADWYASVRMHSARTVGFEFTNNENTLGNFTADGALILMQDGREFIDIFGFWDWRKVPGVTAYDDGKPMKCNNNDELKKNHSEHVGGMTHDGTMAATMEINRDGLRALKSMFFFDDCIVNLGTGIQGSREMFNSVTTAVDQNHLSPEGFKRGDNWAYHAGRGYVCLDGAQMNVTGEHQRGLWDDIEPSFDGKWDEGEVFKCWFEHPMEEVDAGEAGYAYAVFPRTPLGKVKSVARKWAKKGQTKDLKVLCNDSRCQAVMYKGTVAAVFHEAGTYELASGTVTVSEPQVYINSKNGEKHEILPSKSK